MSLCFTIAVSAALRLLPAPIPPADSAREPLAFAQARAQSSERAPEVRLARAREAIARAQIRTAGAWPNPTLTVTTAAQTAKLSTGVSMPLPLFGQAGTQADAAAADVKAAQADSRSISLQSRLDASLSWIDLWEAQARAALLEQAAQDADRLASVAEEKFEAGSAPQVDVVRAKALKAQAHSDAVTQTIAVVSLAARLQAWLGPQPAAGWRAEGDPGYGDRPPEFAKLLQQLDAHPVLAHDSEMISAAGAHVKAERRQRVPLIDALVTVNALDPTLPHDPSVVGGTDLVGGLAIELPILNRRDGPIEHAEAEQALAEEQAAADRLRLEAACLEAHTRAIGAAERATTLEREVVPSAIKARSMTEEGYRDGRVDLLRLLEAQRAVLDAKLAGLDARAAYVRAMVDLERASGIDLLELK
jgi:cobalt-zinc-cadmium efflux system outer membrane protein